MSAGKQFEFFLQSTSKTVKKGEVLVKTGELATEAYYVVKGCLRSYILDKKGKEHIYQFAPEDWIISDLEFNKNRGKAFCTIDAIEDSEVKVLSLDQFSLNSVSDPKLFGSAINKLQNRIYALQKRVIHLLSYSAEERYNEFVKTYPNLYSRIPLKMIASYLGVTPESLSRVRKELVKGK